MDEMADSDGRAFLEDRDDSIEDRDDSLGRGPMPRPGEAALSARAPSDQPVLPR
jgi:hypothetical protein